MSEHPPFPWYVLAKTEGSDRVMRLLALDAISTSARYRCDTHDLEVDAKWQDGRLVIFSEDWVDSIYDLPALEFLKHRAGACPIHSLHEISYTEWKGRTSASPRHFIVDTGDWNDMQEYPPWQEGYAASYHTYKLNNRPGYDIGDRIRDLSCKPDSYQSVCRFNTSVPWTSPTQWIKLTIYGNPCLLQAQAPKLALTKEYGADGILAELRLRVDSFRLS